MHILSSFISWKLYSRASNMHCYTDASALVGVVQSIIVSLSGNVNIIITNTPQRSSVWCSFFVPNFHVFRSGLWVFFLLFFCFSGQENFFIIWRFEWRVSFLIRIIRIIFWLLHHFWLLHAFHNCKLLFIYLFYSSIS